MADEPAARSVEQALVVLNDATERGSEKLQLPIKDLRVHLDAYRQHWVDVAMSAASGNQSEAARLLGVPRATLRDWLHEQR